MRTDAKFGVLCALIVGLVAGGYFTFRGSEEEPIPLGVARSEQASDGAAEKRRPALTQKPAADIDRSRPPGRRQARAGRPATSDKIETEQTGSPGRRVVRRDTLKTGRPPGQQPSGSPSLPLTSSTGGWSSSGPRSGSPPGDSADAASGSPIQRPGDVLRRGAGRTSGSDLAGSTTPGGSDPQRTSRDGRTPVRDARASSRFASKPAGGGRNETHTVQQGDTFSSLSQQYYGDERHIQALIQANPQIANPNLLKIGVVLQIPETAVGSAAAAKGPVRSERRAKRAVPPGSRTYVVQSGDSFYKIARDELGDPLRWQELFELNRSTVGDDPSKLGTGAVLVLPEKK